MREKLALLMKSEGLTSCRLAEILDVQPSGISHILSGRNKPGYDLLVKILRRFPRVDPDWLLLDGKEMYRADSPSFAGPKPALQATDLFTSDCAGPESSEQRPLRRENSLAAQAPGAASAAPAKATQIVVCYDDGTCESFRTRP